MVNFEFDERNEDFQRTIRAAKVKKYASAPSLSHNSQQLDSSTTVSTDNTEINIFVEAITQRNSRSSDAIDSNNNNNNNNNIDNGNQRKTSTEHCSKGY